MITKALLGVGVALVLGCAQAPEPAAEAAEAATPAECPMHDMHMAGGQMAMEGPMAMQGMPMEGMQGMTHTPGEMPGATSPCPPCAAAPTVEVPEGEPTN